MISGLFSVFASLFLFFAFIINLFILIGQLSNKVVLNSLYFAQVSDGTSNSYYNLGLWNYCTATGATVESCQHPTPAYNWASTPGINQVLPNQANSLFIKGLFLANFILFFIGLGLSFILWILSMPLCCTKRRGIVGSLTTLIFINFLVMLAALIFSLVFILRGLHILHNQNSNFNGHAGNSLWLTIGSVVALGIAFILSTGACCCIGVSAARKTRRNKVEPNIVPVGGAAKFSKEDNPQQQPLQQPQQTASTPMSGRRSYDFNQSVYQSVGQPSPRVLQQPYHQQEQQQPSLHDDDNFYSPVIQQQGFQHQPRNETHGHIRVPGFPSSNNQVPNTTV
ncbi:unnamed protein product [Cunninghamella echinulata]